MADESITFQTDALPLSDEEADGLLAPLAGRSIALAVSGGGDSTALLVLISEWLDRLAKRGLANDASAPIVLTIDHGLRAASAGEAVRVAALAAGFGLTHETLRWTGPHPRHGLMAAARNARYRLAQAYLAAEAVTSRASPRTLVTAHTADDRAETLVMRLARGSGITGLGAERAEASMVVLDEQGRPTGARLAVSRPLLGVSRARLRATLRVRGIDWIEDPTNAVEAFERTRVRGVLATLAPLGVTGTALARSAERLVRADRALIEMAEDWIDRHVDWPAGAFASLPLQRLQAAPDEISIRVLALLLARQGGGHVPSRLAEAEAVSARLAARRDGSLPPAFTLAGAVFALRLCAASQAGQKALRLDIFREPGRRGLPAVDLAPGQPLVWDGRFSILAASDLTGPLLVRTMTPTEWADAHSRHGHDRSVARGDRGQLQDHRITRLPLRARTTVPSVWRGAELLAAPHVGLGQLRSVREGSLPGPGEIAIGSLLQR